MYFVHVPCGVFGFVDLLAIKSRGNLLAQTPALQSLFGYYFLFVMSYLVLLFVNYAFTKNWPYGFMKAMGMSPIKWMSFIVVQSGVLSAFVVVAIVSMNFAPILGAV